MNIESLRRDDVERLMASRRFKLYEALPWLAAALVYVFLPQYLPLGTQVIVMILFVMSFDLLLGYAGIVTLGHAAYYGAGAYAAGLIAVAGWHEPITALLLATVIAGLLGLITGVVMLRTSGLALLMLSIALTMLLGEAANHLPSITGGADGLQGITIAPIFGRFSFDLYGHVAYLYSLAVLFVAWLFMRHLVNTPFGRSLIGIRQNPARMEAIGVPVWWRRLVAFTIASAIAGLAGGLSAQTNQFVSLGALGFELSGTVLVILVLGGAGRLYGAFVGAPLYMIAQDLFSKDDPVFWLFWLGLMLLGIVLFARGGALGLLDFAGRLIAAAAKARLPLGRPAQ